MRMKLHYVLALSLFGLFLRPTIKAQGVITIDHKTQRYIGDISTLDRGKYTNAHILFTGPDAAFESFKTEYNIDKSYIGGRQFWNPFGKVNNGVIPNVKKNYNGVREVNPFLVATGTAGQLMYDDNLDYSIEDVSAFSQQAAEYVAQSYRDEWDLVPAFIEPFNEPMVHATDFYPEGRETPTKYISEKIDVVITKICEYHKDLGQAIHAIPELANMQVMGFASAYPELENNNFDLWNTRFKKFIDIAGEDVDIFSLHLYDGSGINNSGGRRSGSNAEAILDMIEAYSFIKYRKVKPLAVTEYGRLVPNQPGWTSSNGMTNYEPIETSQASRSQIHLAMSFMERADHMVITIPFNVSTRNPKSQYSKSSIWINTIDGIELTQRKNFYEVWKDVKGERVRINSTNVDIQTQAFVSDKQLYVVLNNLNDDTQTVNLGLLEPTGLQNVHVKRLKIFLDKLPELSESKEDAAPSTLSLEYGETVVLTYNFENPITFHNTIRSTKYYATEYLKPISANELNAFTLEALAVGNGEATLRLGVGRAHGLSLKPTVTVNGTEINTNGDIIRGYDQNTRKQFFGTLEIPVSMSHLKEGANEVQVKFPDGGGHISSVILQVQKSEKPVEDFVVDGGNVLGNAETIANNIEIFPNPVQAGDSVTINSKESIKQLKVFSLNGLLIYQGTSTTISTKGFRSGVYVVNIELEKSCQSVKLVIR